MPWLINKASKEPEFFDNQGYRAALATGKYKEIPGTEVGVESVLGDVEATSVLDDDQTLASQEAVEEAILEERYGDSPVTAGLEGFARGATFGLYDVVRPGSKRAIRERRERNPTASVIGAVGGSLVGGPSLGARLVGKGLVARGTAEAAGFQFGQGVSELTLSEEPIDAERVVSELVTNPLLSGVAGGAAGYVAGKLTQGMTKARNVAKSAATKAVDDVDLVDDLASLNKAELRVAEEGELATISASKKAQSQTVVDDLSALRSKVQEDKVHYRATYKATAPVLKKIGARSFAADKKLDNLLGNPKNLAAKPSRALEHLQKVEHEMEDLVKNIGLVRAESREYVVARVTEQLEMNRAIQQKIEGILTPAASERLTNIKNAQDLLGAPRKAGLGTLVAQGAIMAGVTAATYGAGLPAAGVIGPILGASAAGSVGRMLTGRMAGAAAASAARGAKALDALLGVTDKTVKRLAPTSAAAALNAAAFGPTQEASQPQVKDKLVTAYRAREQEIRAQTEPGPDGTLAMSRRARQALGNQLSGVKALSLRVADMVETILARKVAFLASKLPLRPDIAAMHTGPDTWRPSHADMAKFARYVRAADDPNGVFERMTDGQVTPEDAEALMAVFPEMFQEARMQLSLKLPTLQKSLPYKRRLAISMVYGMPIDPALDPRILRVLQSNFADEAGTTGGTSAPLAQPAFGSVKKSTPEPTPAQRRGG